MATHIVCEAVRKGLETQITALTAGYDFEINRLQSQITILSDEKEKTDQAARTQYAALTKQCADEIAYFKSQQMERSAKYEADQEVACRNNEISHLHSQIKRLAEERTNAEQVSQAQCDALTKQYADEIAHLKSSQVEELAKYEANQKVVCGVSAKELSVEYEAKYTALKKEEQAKRQEQLQGHHHITAKLEAQVLSIQNALEAAKYETLATQEARSKSIENYRAAKRTKISEVEEKSAQAIAECKRRLTTRSLEAILVNLESSVFKGKPSFAVRRNDPLSLIAAKLEAVHPRLGKDDIDFGVQCSCGSSCTTLVTDMSRTMEQLGINDGGVIKYNRTGKSIGRKADDCKVPVAPRVPRDAGLDIDIHDAPLVKLLFGHVPGGLRTKKTADS